MSTAAMQQFVAGLKSRSAETRIKTAQELMLYVKSELREATPDEINAFLDEFNHHIFEMVSGSDVNEKKGGILAIGSNKQWQADLFLLLICLLFFSLFIGDRCGGYDDKNYTFCELFAKFIAVKRRERYGTGRENNGKTGARLWLKSLRIRHI